MSPLEERLRTLLAGGALRLPLPGDGRTAERHRRLTAFGRRDLALARLIEAHTDALAMLAQSGRAPCPNALYGVWAAERADARLCCEPIAGGRWRLRGSKAFCTGVTLCDAALVTATDQAAGRPRLFHIDVRAWRESGAACADTGGWATPAFADTATGTLTTAAAGVQVDGDAAVGPPGWYLDRPGFWHGAAGPAAVWAGGAMALADAALAYRNDDPHRAALLGALAAQTWGMTAHLVQAGNEIDADPDDRSGSACTRALSLRHQIERAVTDVLDRFGRACGPVLLAFDADVARRHAELSLYIRQCHGERDLALLYRTLTRRDAG